MGIGHRIYKVEDPRVRHLRDAVLALVVLTQFAVLGAAALWSPLGWDGLCGGGAMAAPTSAGLCSMIVPSGSMSKRLAVSSSDRLENGA